MVAINKQRIHCIIVAVPVEAEAWSSRGALAHDLVPGADPYVAELIKRLQDEVRHERRREQLHRQATQPRFQPHQLRDDMEIPWFDLPLDDEPLGDDPAPEYGGEVSPT